MLIKLGDFSFEGEQFLAGGVIKKSQVIKKGTLFKKTITVPTCSLIIDLKSHTEIRRYNLYGTMQEIYNLYHQMLEQLTGKTPSDIKPPTPKKAIQK